MLTDNNLLIFKAISNFILELGEIYGGVQKSLKLYCRLINKTTIVNEKPISKHINAFKLFCNDNLEAIQNKKISELENTTISYSERVYINLSQIFKLSDKETQNVIWSHLLTILALINPESNAKEILNEKKNNEKEFVNNIVENLSENIDTNSDNPMDAINGILNSGMFSNLIQNMTTGIDNGNLDMQKLTGSVQNMVNDMTEKIDDKNVKDKIKETTNNINSESPLDIGQMLGPMMNMLNNLQNPNDDSSNDSQPDIGQMLGPMMNMLNNLQPPSQSTNLEVIDELDVE